MITAQIRRVAKHIIRPSDDTMRIRRPFPTSEGAFGPCGFGSAA
jgi:hypothetical protein